MTIDILKDAVYRMLTFKDAFRDDVTAELLKEYTQQHAPEKMLEIEQKHIEVYEKRHLRIVEKIGVITK